MSLAAPLWRQTVCGHAAEVQDAVGSNGSQSRVACWKCGMNLYHKHVGFSEPHRERLRADEALTDDD